MLRVAKCENYPSYLHEHSALSCASSRHSGGKELLTGSDSDPRHGSAHLFVRSAAHGSPGSSRDARARGVPRGRNGGQRSMVTRPRRLTGISRRRRSVGFNARPALWRGAPTR